MKNLTIQLVILAITAVALGGCDKDSGKAQEQGKPAAEAKAGATGSEPRAADHAAADVVPGSYEDWCSEHQVPESQCTRCNPDLIPAFRATNDWCDEHGLPESQCLKCNPDLVTTRPPRKQ